MECFWDNLYRQTGPDLLAYFLRRHSHAQLAEDLLQDTFVKAMQKDQSVRQAVSPRAYLFGIARNISADAFRNAAPEIAELPELPAPSIEAADPRLELVHQAIQALPPSHREALELRLRHELSYEEIASVLDIPLGTVRSRLHAAIRQLRATINVNED